MTLTETLNELGQKINKRYAQINRGGCCVYAVAIANELKKRKIAAKVIVSAWTGEGRDINKIRKKVKDVTSKESWRDQGLFFNHVGIEFRQHGVVCHYDSGGVKLATDKLDGMPLYSGYLKLSEAEAVADEREGWNDSFDRRRIPAMARYISKFMDTHLPIKG